MPSFFSRNTYQKVGITGLLFGIGLGYAIKFAPQFIRSYKNEDHFLFAVPEILNNQRYLGQQGMLWKSIFNAVIKNENSTNKKFIKRKNITVTLWTENNFFQNEEENNSSYKTIFKNSRIPAYALFILPEQNKAFFNQEINKKKLI